MRSRVLALVLGLALVLLSPASTGAGGTLEQRVAAATGITRTVDAGLHARAADRAVQIETTFGHCCLSSGEAEVIAWNSGYADPLRELIDQWRHSPDHWLILADPVYTRIGCGTAVRDGATYGVCILAAGHQPPAAPPPPAPPATTLPNTALH